MFPWSKEKDQQHEMGQGKEIIDGITTLFAKLLVIKRKNLQRKKKEKNVFRKNLHKYFHENTVINIST